MNAEIARKALLQACSESIHADPDGAGSLAGVLARLVKLEDELEGNAPEMDRAKAIAAELEKEEAAKEAKQAAKK